MGFAFSTKAATPPAFLTEHAISKTARGEIEGIRTRPARGLKHNTLGNRVGPGAHRGDLCQHLGALRLHIGGIFGEDVADAVPRTASSPLKRAPVIIRRRPG